jgi:rare lipoprotein A
VTRLLRAAVLAALTTAGLAAPPALARSGGSDTASAEAGAVTLSARDGPIVGRKLRFVGTVAGGGADREVSVQRRESDDAWIEVATATTDEKGSFSARWKADAAGSFAFRAVVRGESIEIRTAGASASMKLRVYRSAIASTFFDRVTACGRNLRRSTLGVAHKTLPCETKVAFYYRGRRITVPVVDRGPYVAGRTWDLTEATARRLRFDGLGRVGSLVVSKPRR